MAWRRSKQGSPARLKNRCPRCIKGWIPNAQPESARTQLEDRVRLLEQAFPSATVRDTAEEVDESVVVVGHFGDTALEDAEIISTRGPREDWCCLRPHHMV